MVTERFKKAAGTALIVVAFIGAAVFLILRGGTPPGLEIDGIETELTRKLTNPSADKGPAPDFELPTLGGGTFKLADYEGKVVVLNFWATWCAPCRIEIPELIEMQDELKGEGVQFVGISLDQEGREVVEEFAAEARFNYPILLDDGSVSDKFGGIYALPTTILIDRQGNIEYRVPGLVTKSYLMPIIQELMKT